MANYEKGEVPMRSETHGLLSDELVHSRSRKLVSRSATISIPMTSMEPYGRENSVVGHTGPLRSGSFPIYATHGTGNLLQHSIDVIENQVEDSKTQTFSTFRGTGENHADRKNEHLLRSGQLGTCEIPFCTTCPAYLMASTIFEPQFHNARYGDAKGFARKCFTGIMNPHNKVVRQWNHYFALFGLLAIFVDPLFFFLLYVEEGHKCIAINWTTTKTLVLLRSMNDLVYFLNILLQFRIAYVSPRKVGAGDLVDHPNKIALHYMRGYFLLDLFLAIPIPQIMILFVLPYHLHSSGANFAGNILIVAILVQYIPRLYRTETLLSRRSPQGLIFLSVLATTISNLYTFMLFAHGVGSCWYIFGLKRVNQCFRDACHRIPILECMKVLDCGHGHTRHSDLESNTWNNDTDAIKWSNNTDAIECLNPLSDDFIYGIYAKAVPLTTETNMVNKYIYSLFWGFQQISTLAGNQNPSYFVWEVIFTMVIMGLGLWLFAILIGNIQNFRQALGQRRLDMQLRGRGVEQWMSTHRLPEDLKRRVRQAERYSYAATNGVNEEMVMENLPEDLQRDIRRHLFEFIKNVRIFCQMDEDFLYAIYKRLRRKIYTKGSRILCRGGLVEKMFIIVRGELESTGEDGTGVLLSEGDACGEELLTWYLEHSSVSTDGKTVRLSCNKTVTCLTNVDAFSLRAADLEEVIKRFN